MLKALFVGIIISSLAGGAMAASYGTAPPKTGTMMSAPAAMGMSTGAPAKIGTTSMGKAWVDLNGMTLYTFDKDTAGVSTCYDACAAMWPAYVGKADSKLTEGWTLVKRTDGTLQFAFNKKPVYFYAPDKAKGDKLGDGKGGVWHIIAG